MMGEALQQCLKDPSLLDEADLGELEKLAKQFPFFSIVQILLAKKYQLQNHSNAAAQLTKAALTVNDRSRLFTFMRVELTRKKMDNPLTSADDFAMKELKHEEVFASNEELHDILKSIHERKQAVLDSEIS